MLNNIMTNIPIEMFLSHISMLNTVTDLNYKGMFENVSN